MLFKNAICYHLPNPPGISSSNLEEMLARRAERYLGKMEREVLSWVKPGGRKSQVLLHDLNGQRLMCCEIQKRLLPASIIKERVDELVAIEEEKGLKVSRASKQEFKDRVLAELTPNAPVKKAYVMLWWDMEENRMVVNTGSRKVAESVLDLLRESIGSLPVTPMATQVLPQRAMTKWLREPDDGPRWLELGSRVRLVDEAEGVFNGVNVDLEGSEVQEMVGSGYQVSQMEIRMPDQASFILTQDFSIKSIKPEDMIKNARGEIDTDSRVADLEADFLIESDMLGFIISQLVQALGGVIQAEAELPEAKVIEAEAEA